MAIDSAHDLTPIADAYRTRGFAKVSGILDDTSLKDIEEVLRAFHAQWLARPATQRHPRAINSAYLTEEGVLSSEQRMTLFSVVSHERILALLQAATGAPLAFMNTQLFFNPVDPSQKNYWHRDIQYAVLSEEDQKAQLSTRHVLHVRLALQDEPGLELVPGSHRRWDTAQERAVRLAEGHEVHEALSTGCVVPLQRGDVLLFSANMLHRGLYGLNRFAFDMLYCDPLPDLLQYARARCLPSDEMLARLSHPAVFIRTRDVLNTLSL